MQNFPISNISLLAAFLMILLNKIFNNHLQASILKPLNSKINAFNLFSLVLLLTVGIQASESNDIIDKIIMNHNWEQKQLETLSLINNEIVSTFVSTQHLPDHNHSLINSKSDDIGDTFLNSTSINNNNGKLAKININGDGQQEEAANEDDQDYDGDEDDFEQNQSMSNICTAGYFFDRIIPEDYPHEISKDVKHINETIERLNRFVFMQ